MRRREFITLVGGAASIWPLAARAQQDRPFRRIGMLDIGEEADRLGRERAGVMRDELAKLGWIEGRNVQFDLRYSADDPNRVRAHADELVRLTPDIIVAISLTATRALLQRTRTIPVVFTNVGDPVAGGLLQNLARPEGNVTGVTATYQSMGGKWVELLKEAVPPIERAALVFNAATVSETYFASIDAAADLLAVKSVRMPYHNAADLERAIDAFAAEPNGGLFMVPPPPSFSNRELINRLAVKHRLPTIYASKHYPAEGGMMGYGANTVELTRLAASYVNRILRGAKISELPVQFPAKFELVINLKAARAIGLDIPATLTARADELIQ